LRDNSKEKKKIYIFNPSRDITGNDQQSYFKKSLKQMLFTGLRASPSCTELSSDLAGISKVSL